MTQVYQLRTKTDTQAHNLSSGLILSGGMSSERDNAALWELAKESAEKVAVIAATLSAKEAKNISRNRTIMPLVKTLGELAGNLQRVSFIHDKYEHQSKGGGSPDKFLTGLQHVCTFMWPSQKLREYNLEIEKPTSYPLLESLQQWNPGEKSDLVDAVERSLKLFISSDALFAGRHQNHHPDSKKSKSRVKAYFGFLESLASPKDQPEDEEQATKANAATHHASTMETPADLPSHVCRMFYGIIKKLWSAQCCCAGPSTAPRHEGRLKLRDSIQITDDYVLFDTVFSRHSTKASKHGIEWQHLQFQISLRQQNVPKVEFSDQTIHPTATAKSPQPITSIKTSRQFCKLLQDPVGPAKICLQVKGARVHQMPDHAPLDDDIAHEQSVSLAYVLQHHDLVAKKRLLLAYVLAKSFWQFYDSDLMSVRWTTAWVHFFHEHRDEDDDDETCILDDSPYFALPASETGDPLLCSEYLPTEPVVHRYPRLLALGKLILDLGRKKHHSAQIDECRSETFQERISTDLNDMRRALRRKTWPRLDLQDEARQICRVVLENCSNPRLFEVDQTNGSGEEKDMLTIEERRAIIYQRIVHPLKSLLEKLGWLDCSGNIHLQDDQAAKGPDPPSKTATANKASFLSDEALASAARLKAQQWLLRIQSSNVNTTLFAGFQANRSLGRIRIAVIDTGYDPSSTFFCDPSRKRRIQKWKDLVDDNSVTRQDEDGHGTYVLSLLMKVIPVANFYVVRVARNTADLANSTSNVAQAIKWAAEEQQVDIISMSFGFDKEIPINGKYVISNAISDALRARDQKILFFAAAANEGGNQPEMFPANHPHVISIRGTDDKGWLQRFNPPRGYDGVSCFMTLGQDVPGAGLSRNGGIEVSKSGTSVSTPIAAGIAAMLLSYAALFEEDLSDYVDDGEASMIRHQLSTVSGMRRMFRKMSTEMLDGWYYLSAEAFLRLPTHQARLGWLAL